MRGNALHIPWVAVADLMLSHLCHQVRPEIFRLEPYVQAVLLKELHEDRERFWSADGRSSRLEEVAQFLIQYAAHQLNHPSHYVREAARAERLNAQTISQPELVRQQLQKTAVTLQPQKNPVATLRLASLVSSFNRSVNLTRSETDQTRQDFNKLQAYTNGQAQLAEGKSTAAVAQQFRTAFGSDQYIEIAGETLPGLRQLTNEPVASTLPSSIGITLAGDEITIVLAQGSLLPTSTDPIMLRGSSDSFNQGLGFLKLQLFQGESTSPLENRYLGSILIDDAFLYRNNTIDLNSQINIDTDNIITLTVSHDSGFKRELVVSLVDIATPVPSGVQDFSQFIYGVTQGVPENAHLPWLNAVSDWLNKTNARSA